jgi:hypothetical protein
MLWIREYFHSPGFPAQLPIVPPARVAIARLERFVPFEKVTMIPVIQWRRARPKEQTLRWAVFFHALAERREAAFAEDTSLAGVKNFGIAQLR